MPRHVALQPAQLLSLLLGHIVDVAQVGVEAGLQAERAEDDGQRHHGHHQPAVFLQRGCAPSVDGRGMALGVCVGQLGQEDEYEEDEYDDEEYDDGDEEEYEDDEYDDEYEDDESEAEDDDDEDF